MKKKILAIILLFSVLFLVGCSSNTTTKEVTTDTTTLYPTVSETLNPTTDNPTGSQTTESPTSGTTIETSETTEKQTTATTTEGKEDTSSIIKKVTGNVYYTSPDGVYGNTGTKESPYAIFFAFQYLKAGDTLIVQDGTYSVPSTIRVKEGQDGSPLGYIRVVAEHANKAIIDFSKMAFNSTNRGIQIDGNYWYIYGLNVKSAGDNGMYIGGSYNIIEMCKFYENRDTGLQLGRSDGSYNNIEQWPHNNLIKNCTSFNNYDDETYGENADGFAAKLTTGEGNIFDGCIAYRNSDDGWDLYAKEDSGNVGITIIINCVSFENGWTLTKHLYDYTDSTSEMTYLTRDGDGIGFKLGGSQMEGSVYVANCISYNNKLGGFSDNSNPGVISIKNCTSYNNSVSVNADGTPGPSDGQSRNFELARKNVSGTNSDSYNNFVGLLSYVTNEADSSITYSEGDTYKGSAGYSILSKYDTASKTSAYYAFYDYMDGNSYDSSKAGTKLTKVLTDSIFKSLTNDFTISEDIDIHSLLRNEDGSINTHDMLKIVDEDLLKFNDGNPIGGDLTKGSYDEYEHFVFTDIKENEDTINSSIVKGAYDVLDVMCNSDAVFQDVKLLTVCNNCKVSWTSSDENIIKVSNDEYKSFSNLKYVYGIVTRDRGADKDVTLTAHIYYEGASIDKEFVLHIKHDEPAIGTITGYQNKYIIDQYGVWENPSITVSNLSSNSGQLLEVGKDYEVEVTYKYAENKNSPFYSVSMVYTSVPGVYEITYNVSSLIDADDKVDTSFYLYVSSNYAEIDLASSSVVKFHVTDSGVDISATLSSTSGYAYVYKSTSALCTATKVRENGKVYDINDENLSISFEDDNESGYYLFIVFGNKADTFLSNAYSSKIESVKIATCDEFYKLVTGSSSSTAIYNLENDLDFKDYDWKETDSTSTFGGLFNGNGHTISNITIVNNSARNVNIFYKVSGGSIINTKFENITLTGSSSLTTKVGIVGQMVDGSIYNISLKNITAFGYQGVAGLVGQCSGGKNYISNVSLVNDADCSIVASGKYVGGIVGNFQKDSSEEFCELTISNCYINGVIGGKTDTGGYSGGIVGRCKNEYDISYLSINRCVVYGTIMTGKNYAGGILGGCDNGSGTVRITYCLVNINLYYAGSIIDGIDVVSVKNGSPIIGRQTLGAGLNYYTGNYASFADYNSGVSDSEGFDVRIYRESFWKTVLKFDTENVWLIDLDEGTASLRFID